MLLPTNRKSHTAFPLAYLHLTQAHSKVTMEVMHISTANIYKMITDRENITTAYKYEIERGLSISIIRVDLGLF